MTDKALIAALTDAAAEYIHKRGITAKATSQRHHGGGGIQEVKAAY